MRKAEPVFSLPAFFVALAGIAAAPVVAFLGDRLLGDRFGFPPGLAAGLAILAAVALAGIAGVGAALLGRRLCFYEIAAGTFVLYVVFLGPVYLEAGKLSEWFPILSTWQQQGDLVLGLGL